jgi:hypothetical protein
MSTRVGLRCGTVLDVATHMPERLRALEEGLQGLGCVLARSTISLWVAVARCHISPLQVGIAESVAHVI